MQITDATRQRIALCAQAALLRLLRVFWPIACGLFAMLWLREIWVVTLDPAAYEPLWGGEGPVAGVWYYASQSRYVFHLVCMVVWYLAGIYLCLYRWTTKPRLVLAHVSLSLLWLFFSLFVD